MGIRVSNRIDCTLCSHYNKADDVCSYSPELNRQLLVAGKGYASRCNSFRSIRDSISNEMALENCLEFMLAGNSEFTMLSVKTGKKLRYRLDRKLSVSPNEEDEKNKNNFIYWVNTECENGTLIYAGVLYFDNNDYTFKFGRGARGNLDAKDIRINSLLFVINKLYNKNYNMQLKIYNTRKCGMCNARLEDDEVAKGLCKRCLDRYIRPSYLIADSEIEGTIDPKELFNPEPLEQEFEDSYDPWFNSSTDVWGQAHENI